MSERPPESNAPISPPQARVSPDSKRGCWKFAAIGCVGLVIVAIIVSLVAYLGIKGFIGKMSEHYTSPRPVKLPRVDATAAEVADVLDRVGDFAAGLRSNTATPPLVLTSRDVNILISHHTSWKEMAGRVRVTIENDTITGETSIPLDELGSLFEGRYLNGSATFRVGMTAGRLHVYIESMAVGSDPLPEEFVSAMKAQNMAEDVNKNPDVVAFLGRLESIEVRGGDLIIVPKSLEASQPPQTHSGE